MSANAWLMVIRAVGAVTILISFRLLDSGPLQTAIIAIAVIMLLFTPFIKVYLQNKDKF
jgi:hypothetical protein